jgi:single-strand DNA-binding protein
MLIGNLGRDAETRHTPSGVAVTNFSIATARRVKDQSGEWRDDTDWHDIVLWRGENVAPYLLKGTQVYIEGRLQTRSWDDQSGQKKYRTEVVVDGNMGLMLLGGGRGGEGGGGGGRSSGGGGDSPSGPAEDDMAISDDDVPF